MNVNPTPPSGQASAKERSAAYAKRKKIVKVIIIVFAVIMVLSVATMSLNPDELVKKWFSKGNDDLLSSNIEFYPVDWDYNIMLDEEYLEYDRRISFYDPDSGATYWVEENEVAAADEYVQFFHSYFQAVIYGNAQDYQGHFSSDYEGELPEEFTMQMVYDIELRPHTTADGGRNYIVNYRIHKNNGTFRRDIGSDEGREYVFRLVEQNGRWLIAEMGPYTSYR